VKPAPRARKTGLARALSKLGYCSRSQASGLIRGGRVRLNGVASKDVEIPVRLGQDRIEIDGSVVSERPKVYFMLNKPRGLVTTASDEKGRKTVYSCLGKDLAWLAPAGRLDKASEGLLLFTNDSEWAARLLSPESHVEKTYHVQVGALVDESFSRKIEKGFRTGEGEILRVKKARLLRHGERNTWVEVILDEGKNRQIRRILKNSDLEVLRLIRVAVGPLQLGPLPKGSLRALSPQEKLSLDAVMNQPGRKH
jgi:23S rRNA pseudouridine2605 synthase